MPAIFYMNNTSRVIVNSVRDVNKQAGRNIACYSIDAGFHVFVFVLKEHVEMVKERICNVVGEQLERVIETEIDTDGAQLIE